MGEWMQQQGNRTTQVDKKKKQIYQQNEDIHPTPKSGVGAVKLRCQENVGLPGSL